MEVDVPDSGVIWGKCLRVRVRIDVTKRLIRGKKITIEGGEARWVQFKYERLPNFCYRCGYLSHALKDYLESSVTGRLSKVGLQYGAWLRGDPFGRFQKEPGIYGGGENRGGRGGVTEGGLEQPNVQSDVPGDHLRGAVNFVMGSASLACSSLVGDDATLEAPIQLTVTPHEIGKVDGADGKSEENTSTKIDNSPATHCSRFEAPEESQWVKRHERVLGKAPIEVSPLSTSTFPISSSIPEFLVSEEDIPPSFGGQPRRAGKLSMDHAILGGPLGCCEQLGQTSPGSLFGPSLSSNGPSFVSTRAVPTLDYTKLGHTLDKSMLITPHVSLGPQLPETSNNKHSKHVTLASSPKWSRVLCSSHGSKEALLFLVDKKRGFGVDSV